MRDIFTGLFSKVFGFFRQTEEKQDTAKDTAVNRLRVVLMQDRTNLTPELLEKMRGELIELLSKYVEMDKEGLDLNFEQEGDQMALMLSIPVLRAKDEDEIEEEEADDENSEKEEISEESDEASENESNEDNNDEENKKSKKSSKKENESNTNSENGQQ